MTRSRAVACVCWLWLLVLAGASSSAVRVRTSPPEPRRLQVATEIPAVIATATPAAIGSSSNTSSSATEDDEARTTAKPSTSAPAAAVEVTSTPATGSDGRVEETETGVRRDSSLGTEGIVGIVAGALAVVALAVAFAHVGSSKRKRAREDAALATQQDLASSTMSVKDVKYVESFDSSAAGSPRTSIAAIRRPAAPAPRRSQVLGSSLQNSASTNGAGRATRSPPKPTPANAVQSTPSSSASQSAAPHPQAHAAAATIIDVDEFQPSRSVRTFSKSQRSGSGHDALKKAPLSPESYLKFAQSNSKRSSFHRSRRRSSRHSRRAMESPSTLSSSASPDSSAVASAALPQRPRMRFSRTRRSSVHSSDDERATEIPMLGGGGAMAPARNSQNDSNPPSPRDIPVLARGSEESVDSVEDDDVEISI